MKKIDFYLIRAISNLHVGSGEGDFSVIDKQVQRDPITGLPTIHASGIKGALREAVSQASRTEKKWETTVLDIFGADPKRKDKQIKQGLNNFFEGRLLSLPIRSSHDFFYRATCPLVLQEFINMLDQFKYTPAWLDTLRDLAAVPVAEGSPCYFGTSHGDIFLEDWKAKHHDFAIAELSKLFDGHLALLSNKDFQKLGRSLPIIARNYLNDGISENLWYEEVAPRESLFFTMVSRLENRDDLNEFLETRDHLVQLGANATVGYGLCTLKTI